MFDVYCSLVYRYNTPSFKPNWPFCWYSKPEENQLLITMIFLGLGLGQLIFGPISDSFGRKPVVYIGFTVFVLASFLCIAASQHRNYGSWAYSSRNWTFCF